METRNSITSASEFPLDSRNGIRTDYPRDASIQSLFEDQVRRAPGAVAVACAGVSLTYSEVNRRANALARRLAQCGFAKGTPVGICMERSLEMVIGLLAILKAGGAYVPLDPTWPGERLAYVIADTQVPVILTKTRWRDAIAACDAAALRLLLLDTDDRSESGENLAVDVHAEGLAYVMYTSGSTGKPKGVAVMHRGVVRLVKQTDYAAFSPDETFLQLAPISFDASTFEIWGALLNGGRLVVMPECQPSLEEIGRAIREHGVTTLWLTSGLFNVMIDERLDDLRPLRQLLAGGDVLSVPHVRRALRELATTRIINGYGPTESTTFACCHTISPDENLEHGVPIGRPIANTFAHILDEELQPVDAGATGELFIGGDGIAHGYWNSPELTAEKFIERKGERIYRTGDLVRRREDGVIEFLGRADHQIKLRGFRIEPAEIENTIAHHDAIRTAVVVARGRDNAKELIAYFVPKIEGGIAPAALREWLRGKLPDYLIPSAFVPLRALPLTSNGKIDRRALPDPHSVQHAAAAPESKTGQVIAEVWRAVLGFEGFGTGDNFFDIGGNSIRIMEVHSKLSRVLRRPIPVTALFQHPTIASLARFLDAAPESRPGVSPMLERARKQRASLAQHLFRRTKA